MCQWARVLTSTSMPVFLFAQGCGCANADSLQSGVRKPLAVLLLVLCQCVLCSPHWQHLKVALTFQVILVKHPPVQYYHLARKQKEDSESLDATEQVELRGHTAQPE